MPELEDEQLDSMLQGFFAGALDPQHGRAEWSFRRYLTDTAHGAWRQRTWLIGAFVTGMAASIAIMLGPPLLRGPASPVDKVAVDHPSPMVVPSVRVTQSHTTDQGVMLFGNDTPIHVLRREQLKETRWLDDHQQVQSQQTTPQEELLFIKEPTY